MGGTTCNYEMKSEIRGYRVYGNTWKPSIYETDPTGNKLVGHLPAEFSRIACYFIENGREISCQVIGKRVHSQGPRGGTAIPCKLQVDVLNTKQCSEAGQTYYGREKPNSWKIWTNLT